MLGREMAMKVRTVGDIIILEPAGELTTNNGAKELGNKISSLIELGLNKILLNLNEIYYADLGGIEALLVAYDAAMESGGNLKFSNPGNRIHYLLSMTKLSMSFDVHPNEALAIASFRR